MPFRVRMKGEAVEIRTIGAKKMNQIEISVNKL